MPGTEVVAVIALAPLPGSRAEVVVVGRGTGREALAVSERWPRARLVPAPRRVVAGVEVRRRAVGPLDHVVPDSEHRAGNAVDEGGRGFVASRVAASDVSSADEDLAGYRLRHVRSGISYGRPRQPRLVAGARDEGEQGDQQSTKGKDHRRPTMHRGQAPP